MDGGLVLEPLETLVDALKLLVETLDGIVRHAIVLRTSDELRCKQSCKKYANRHASSLSSDLDYQSRRLRTILQEKRTVQPDPARPDRPGGSQSLTGAASFRTEAPT